MAVKRGTGKIAVLEIQAAIAKYGYEGGPKVLRETTYAHVSRPTWYRWLREAQAGPKTQASAIIQQAMAVMPADVLPAAPSPAIIAKSPVVAKSKLDFMGRLEKLYSDGEMLREHSVIRSADGIERIKLASQFATSIRIRSDLLERALQAYEVLYDWQQMNQFYDLIVQEVAKIDPTTAARIMERLDELNREKGFTARAQI